MPGLASEVDAVQKLECLPFSACLQDHAQKLRCKLLYGTHCNIEKISVHLLEALKVSGLNVG